MTNVAETTRDRPKPCQLSSFSLLSPSADSGVWDRRDSEFDTPTARWIKKQKAAGDCVKLKSHLVDNQSAKANALFLISVRAAHSFI